MDFKNYSESMNSLMKLIDEESILSLIDEIVEAYRHGNFIYVIGNGGSGATASHFCEDFAKSTITNPESQKRLKIISLTDNTPFILALGNDIGYESIFVEQLKHYASLGDLLISISGSGNSKNVLKAVEYAKEFGMKTFSLTGYDGGILKKISDKTIHIPSFDMGMVESIHTIILHYVLDNLKVKFKELNLKA
jgi:D-sedoheptulose 7-phosphate isomerase